MGVRELARRWRQTTPRGAIQVVMDARAYGDDVQFPLRWRNSHPRTGDSSAEAGDLDPHYFHQDLWAARRIFEAKPTSHLDVGSRVDGFVAHVLTFMPVTVVDVRALSLEVEGLSFLQADGRFLEALADGSQASVSSLHALEHYGLGRYGDPIDTDGWRKGCTALARIVAPGGRLYFSVPVGAERLEFNAHRVFDPRTIIEAIGLPLVRFGVVDQAGRMHPDAEPDGFERVGYACGLFEFERPL